MAFIKFALFKFYEQANITEQMTKEEEIIYDAIRNLKQLTDMKDVTFFRATAQAGYDYDIIINGITFACEVKTQVNKTNYNLIVQELNELKVRTIKPLMIVAQYFAPNLHEIFSQDGINTIESNGNCNIRANPLFIYISGQKAVLPKETKGRAFNEAGLKLIFYFLQEFYNINKPYRKISEETGLSLGTIKNVVEDLYINRFVIITPNGRFLTNRIGLLNIWQIYYNQTLKPKLLLKEMEFVDDESRKNWKDIALPNGMCWGGEGGAFLIDKYLVPEQFVVYTEVPSVMIMMTRKVKFQENGKIRLYQKFWKGGIDEKVAPKILIYADLMGSGNSRCIEAAQRLIANGI